MTIDPAVIGSPSLMWWQVYVMVGVDTATHNPPDYIMDSAPEGSNTPLMPFT